MEQFKSIQVLVSDTQESRGQDSRKCLALHTPASGRGQWRWLDNSKNLTSSASPALIEDRELADQNYWRRLQFMWLL